MCYKLYSYLTSFGKKYDRFSLSCKQIDIYLSTDIFGLIQYLSVWCMSHTTSFKNRWLKHISLDQLYWFWSSCLLHVQIKKKHRRKLVAYSFWHHYRGQILWKQTSFPITYSEIGCGLWYPMPVSSEAKFAEFEDAVWNCTIKCKILMVFKIFVACLLQNTGISNSSHAVRDLGRVRQYPPWLLFAAFVDSMGYPRYNPQKTRKQWRTRDRRFHWLWGWFPDLKIIFML